jgi:predicted enzyme related to lactoylglutathione lyase
VSGPAELRGPRVRTIIVSIRPRQEDRMQARRIMANLRVADIDAAKSFYTDFLGLTAEEFNMGWVARYTSPETGANIQLVTRDAAAAEDSVVSIFANDVEVAYEEARRAGYEIVHPLTTEPWGVRRFFVRAPDGNVINIVHHPE